MVMALAALLYLRWADFQEAEQEAIAAFDGTEYDPALPASLHWRLWHLFPPFDLKPLLAERLPDALERLNNDRHNALATHLHRIAPVVKRLGRLSPQSLDVLIHGLAEQSFETPTDRRALLNVLDSVLNKASHRYSGEHRTPDSIAQLLVELAAPNPGDRIYDPCFGSAGLLTAAYDYVLRDKTGGFSRTDTPPLAVFGVERNLEAYAIGLTRLALAGIDDPQLELGNSLERLPSDNLERDGFDVVLANPPWNMRINAEGIRHFPVRTTDSTGLFVQHALSHLRPKGRAVIVVPQGVLFRGGSEQHLRRMLLEQHTVEAIISLPEKVFMPYTAVRASILVLQRGGSTTDIRMVDGSSLFSESRRSEGPRLIRPAVKEFLDRVWNPRGDECSWRISVESLAGSDWDFTPRRRDQSGLLGVLDALRSEVSVLPLKECCQILSGRAIRSSDLVDGPMGEEPIPYIRIKDVQRGQATKGSSWLSPDAVASVDVRLKLRAGDVLLSKSGAIGKVGVVRNGGVGAIAANGFHTLRPDRDRLDPHFLLAYLDSSECRSWLDDRAVGSAIRRLSRRALEELPVPLPPLQLQQRVAETYREHGVDALAFLAQLLTEGERDPIAEWVEKAIGSLPPNTDSIHDPLDLTHLDRLAAEVQPFRNEAAHGRSGESPLMAWVLSFNESVSRLRGVRNVPRGPGLLSVLQESARGLRDTLLTIKGHLPNEARARTLTKFVADWLDMACSALLNDVKLIFTTGVEWLPAGELGAIPLQVHNRGPLPLRDFRITTDPDWGEDAFDYLAENGMVQFDLTGIGPKVAGDFTISVSWTGSTLDGRRVSGVREMAFEVRDTDSQGGDDQVDLGGSPYVCGDPVRPERNDVFFGREELLDQIRRQIVESGNVVLLEGNRRSGKSSILWHLEGPKAIPGWMGIYCSLQGTVGSPKGAGVPTVEVFREISDSIAKRLRTLGGETPLPDGTVLPPDKEFGIARARREGIHEASAFSDFRDYAEVALKKLAEHGLGLLLMLDEFDKLQEGIDSGVTSPQVPENIRFMVQTYPRFSAILTGSRRLKRLREEYWSALFGLGTRFGITSLSDEAARRLVTEPVKGRLTYSREAVERAISLTAGQPFLLQCLCNRVFDMVAQLKIRSVTLDHVDKAGNVLVEENEHFAKLWDYARSDRRRFILALFHREAGNSDPLRLGVIQERLVSHGIEVDDETLIADLEFLRDLELIDLVGEPSGGHYVLSIPLMGMWIEKHQDFSAIRSRGRAETEDQHG